MVKKSLIVFFILFIGYSWFLMEFKRDWHSEQGQYQRNIIKADRYIYSDSIPQMLILGSSLSGGIVPDSLSEVYNLAFAGMGVLDGFHVIFKRNIFPPVVFIETNYFFRPEKPEFTQSFDSFIGDFSKRYFLGLREEAQPVGILRHFLMAQKKKVSAGNNELKVPDKLFHELVTDQCNYYNHPDSALIKTSLVKLKSYVAQLSAHGTKVYFFEMPVNSAVQSLPLATMVRQSIKSTFPDMPFIAAPRKEYKTLDGLHLGAVEAADYTHYLKRYVPLANTSERLSKI